MCLLRILTSNFLFKLYSYFIWVPGYTCLSVKTNWHRFFFFKIFDRVSIGTVWFYVSSDGGLFIADFSLLVFGLLGFVSLVRCLGISSFLLSW